MRRLASFRERVLLVLVLIALAGLPVVAADWPEIPPEQLTMKEYPQAPGANAIILKREVFTDYGQQVTQVASDVQPFESVYVRIKIFTEQGREWANVQIPYFSSEYLRLVGVEGRTIHPDGTVVEFDGQVFNRPLYRRRGVRLMLKTFTLPDVTVGSIIEYRYKLLWDRWFLPYIPWFPQRGLFCVKGEYTLRPFKQLDGPKINLFWITAGLPEGGGPVAGKDGLVRLEVNNVPPLQDEAFRPPEDELRMRVMFYYSENSKETPDEFWKREGKEWNKIAEDFMNRKGAVKRAVEETVSPSDSPETKLRKLYARVQQIRNLSYERPLTETEAKQLNVKANDNVEDVLSRNYGRSTDLTRLFVAMARAANLDAWVVRVSSRDEYFFKKMFLDWRQLNDEVALVALGDQYLYLDPGTRFCPFGMLAWENTGVEGIRLDKDGGAFITTPVPPSEKSVIERNADFELAEDGTLEGTAQVTFTGQEALAWRLEFNQQDQVYAKKKLKEEIEKWLPPTATVEIEKVENWDNTSGPLRVEAKVQLANFVMTTGRRMLVPFGLFHSRDPHPFSHQERAYPIYFEFPYQEQDTIHISFPTNYSVEALPAALDVDLKAVRYTTDYEQRSGSLVLKRNILVEGFIFRQDSYGVLRAFYDRVRAADTTQLVLRTTQAD